MSESLDSPVYALEQGKYTEQFPHLLKDKNYDQPLNDACIFNFRCFWDYYVTDITHITKELYYFM